MGRRRYFEVELTFENMSSKISTSEPAGCYDAVQTPNTFCRSIGLKIGCWHEAASGKRAFYGKPCMKAIKAFLRKTNLEGYFVIHWLKKICSYDASGKIMKKTLMERTSVTTTEIKYA